MTRRQACGLLLISIGSSGLGIGTAYSGHPWGSIVAVFFAGAAVWLLATAVPVFLFGETRLRDSEPPFGDFEFPFDEAPSTGPYDGPTPPQTRAPVVSPPPGPSWAERGYGGAYEPGEEE